MSRYPESTTVAPSKNRISLLNFLQILLCLRIELPDWRDFGADILLGAIAASVESFTCHTLPDFAQGATEDGFRSVHAAALAVDMFGQDGSMVQLGPQLRGLFA